MDITSLEKGDASHASFDKAKDTVGSALPKQILPNTMTTVEEGGGTKTTNNNTQHVLGELLSTQWRTSGVYLQMLHTNVITPKPSNEFGDSDMINK